MKKFTIVALVDLKPVTVVSDGTKEGTVLNGVTPDEESAFRFAMKEGTTYRLNRSSQGTEASYDSVLGVIAGIHAICPGQIYILRAPKEVAGIVEIADFQYVPVAEAPSVMKDR